jgi:vanillate O-demethylase monooxygenase subunit|tara:strand:+ start:10673 stop:11683 length:1011 start_codon:yes stop_codon:yes gene_type:complete
MKVLKNIWYQVGWVDEIPESSHLARTVAGTAIVCFRDKEGHIVALRDRCAHKFAPLSSGRVCDGAIVCGYHGLAYGSGGLCTKNPHGAIPKRLVVDAFPVEERHRSIWVWLGDADKANVDLIPNLSFIDETPEHAAVKGFLPTACNYQLGADNILDLSHADILHPTTLGGMMIASDMDITEDDDTLCVTWSAKKVLTPPDFPQPFEGEVDSVISVKWFPPGLMVLSACFVPTGQEMKEDDYVTTLHNMVPETDGTTNYLYCVTRRFELDNPYITESVRNTVQVAFVSEDKPMLEAQQKAIGNVDYADLKPVLLSIDAAGVKARRKLERLLREEAEV